VIPPWSSKTLYLCQINNTRQSYFTHTILAALTSPHTNVAGSTILLP
jgi:hypothetical protein